MKKWYVWMSLIVVGAGALIYVFLQFVQPQSMRAYREVSHEVPDVTALPLHTNISGVGPDTFGERVTLVSFFATWCGPCHMNHGMLKIMAQKHKMNIVGINLRDQTAMAQIWLMQNGNPYSCIGSDPQGSVAAAWGVQGIPQMFLVDKHKKVRFIHTGPLTEKRIDEIIVPLVKRLEAEP
jgi:cytochrome c biogenesis protein CcmG/thiol:disulfide interchange protein DsbE